MTLIAWLLAGCTPLALDFPESVDYPIRLATTVSDAPADVEKVKIMAWNIKFGAGRADFWFDTYGDAVGLNEEEVLDNLDAVREQIRTFQPDILMTTEIEVGSKRTAYVDMVENLLEDETLGFNYAAFVPNWEVAYIPDHGLGRVEMGNAVFSRWPITQNIRVDLGPIDEQDALTKYFYLDRCLQITDIALPSGPLAVLNNHPDAYSTDGTKVRQLKEIFDAARAIEGDLVVGGDLNAIPPSSLRAEDFADDPEETEGRGTSLVDYVGEDSVLTPWFDTWQEALEEDHGDDRLTFTQYQAATSEEVQAEWYSHSIRKDVRWTRRLDYLFSNLAWSEGYIVANADDGPGGATITDPMNLSDHAAVWGILELQ